MNFWSSLFAYLKLYRAGFRISISRHPGTGLIFEINRFYWKGKIIRDLGDIDRVGDHYNTILNGHVEPLT